MIEKLDGKVKKGGNQYKCKKYRKKLKRNNQFVTLRKNKHNL